MIFPFDPCRNIGPRLKNFYHPLENSRPRKTGDFVADGWRRRGWQ
jgi:hypothetical protein